jgi:peptidoglycan-associated lipoprotein
MKQSLFLAVALAAALAGCASGVNLDDQVPVETRSAQTTPPGGPGTGGQTQVPQVQAGDTASNQSGPVNVSRIVYFDFDSYVVKQEFQPLIEAHARYLKQDARRHVVIEGNTDDRGGSEYNLALGQKRSEAVRQALTLLGVRDNQIEAVSFGKEKPAATGNDESAWAQNRRAEIAYR